MGKIKTKNVIEYLNELNYDYKPRLKRFMEIGDLTAIRKSKQGVEYRKNYERAVLICALVDYFGSKNVLEFGTGRGYVVACLSEFCNVDRITTIDKSSTADAKKLIHKAGVSIDNMEFVVADANKLTNEINGSFDFFFIDGQHDGKSVKANYNYSMGLATSKHVVVFDDYRNKFPTVKRTINKINLPDPYIVHTDGWLIKNKCISTAKDADKVVDGREYESGMVLSINYDQG